MLAARISAHHNSNDGDEYYNESLLCSRKERERERLGPHDFFKGFQNILNDVIIIEHISV